MFYTTYTSFIQISTAFNFDPFFKMSFYEPTENQRHNRCKKIVSVNLKT
jgi:hypothetical protein